MTVSIPKIEQLFDAALDVAPEERAGWLDANCGGDESLRQRLELLLAADATNNDGMLDEPAVARSSEEMPLRVGPFTPVRLIGEGGMGVVFEATQEGTGRSVALKLVRAGLASPKGMRRFRQEGELLARLNHPGIAHVYDAGTARAEYERGASGERMFVAMELIVGSNLMEYAAQENLSLRRRVEMIEQLAHAMQHAHQRRVLHRDLKPSNILVDETGQAKILDFGIGRIITPTDATGMTLTGQILGTAQYMSPEQAAGDLRRVDTRTDVYSLGVMLYELLAGRPAYELGGLSAIAAARKVAEEEPQRLASRVPVCGGDLDAIVHKAIERDPDARYESADALASDLRRHLNDEVIEARSPTKLEAAMKYARRHRALVGGVAGTTIALILGVIGTSVFGLRAAQQRSVAVWNSYRLAMQAAAASIEMNSFDDARSALDGAPPEHRGWEHDHLSSRLDQWLMTFEGPARGCPCANPDGTRVLSTLEDGRIGVWDIATGESITKFDLGIEVNSLSRTAPAGIAAAAATDGTIVLFSVENGKTIRILASEGTVPFVDVQFDESGAQILGWNLEVAEVARTDGSGVVLSVPAAELIAPYVGIVSAEIYGNGNRLVVSMMRRPVAIYDLQTQKLVAENWITPTPVSLCRTSSGKLLTGDKQRTLKVFSDTLQSVDVLMGHRAKMVADIASMGDGFAVSVDAADGRRDVLEVSRTIRVWDLKRNREAGVLAMPPGREKVRILPLAANRFITGGAVDTPMLLWATNTREKTLLGRHTANVHRAVWSPDGRFIASGPARGSGDTFVQVRDVMSRRKVARLPTKDLFSSLLVFSKDGARLFFKTSSSLADRVESWSTDTWTRISDDVSHTELIAGIGGSAGVRLGTADCFSPDGTIRAARVLDEPGTQRGVLFVNGQRRALPSRSDKNSFAFSPDGKTLAAAASDKQAISLFSTSSMTEIRRIEVGLAPLAIAFSPDGTRLAIVGFSNVIRLLDTTRWEPVVDLRGHTATIHDVQFSPDGRSLVTASSDHTVRIWTTPAPSAGTKSR